MTVGVIWRCPECGKQARHFDATICQHLDPERYVEMERVEVVPRADLAAALDAIKVASIELSMAIESSVGEFSWRHVEKAREALRAAARLGRGGPQ